MHRMQLHAYGGVRRCDSSQRPWLAAAGRSRELLRSGGEPQRGRQADPLPPTHPPTTTTTTHK